MIIFVATMMKLTPELRKHSVSEFEERHEPLASMKGLP
jgi:hypothetical protein